MNAALLLPWFPILLGVGVGGRLLGRARGIGLGILGALFWIAFVHAPVGLELWMSAGKVLAVVVGAVSIVAMGAWSGEAGEASGFAERSRGQAAPQPSARQEDPAPVNVSDAPLAQLTAMLDRFNEWFDEHRHSPDPWPEFDEFIRSGLYQCCRATHVRPFRLVDDSDELIPLRAPDLPDVQRLSARRGIIGHVVTSGRSYRSGDPRQGALVQKLAADAKDPVVWCFAVSEGTRRVGVITVKQLDLAPELSGSLLETAERLFSLFWLRLRDAQTSRSAVQHDPASGLLTREAFLSAAEACLRQSYQQGEPVACAVVAIEGLRQLNDTGRWALADELVRAAASMLKRKVRLDDRLGRFDGSRFVVLLRRVDSELATLIIDQLMFRLQAVCEDNPRWQVPIHVRCGVVGSGVEQPDLRTLMSLALAQACDARAKDTPIASDLPVPEPVHVTELPPGAPSLLDGATR